MKSDLQTFLLAVLGIPAVLTGAWSIHTLDAATTMVYERDVPSEVAPPLPEPQVVTASPVPSLPQPKKPAPTPQVPVSVPTSTAVVVTATPEPVVVKPTVTVKKKSTRRTRAS